MPTRRRSATHPHWAPHGVYPSAGDDQWVAIAVSSDEAWRGLCTASGWPTDDGLATAAASRSRAEIDARVAAWTSARTKETAAELLQAHGVSAMAVMGPLDHVADAHLRDRDAIVTVHHPEVGDERHIANPLRFSRLTQRIGTAAPRMGADTEVVLTSVLGLSPGEVAELVATGVCR